jgi:hypothetical protein
MDSSPHPLWQQIVVLVLVPPVMAGLTWLMMRGWAMGVQGGTVTERTKKRQKIEFWGMLVAFYLIVWGGAVWSWLRT